MKYLSIFLFLSVAMAWDYLLFVQFWPPTWIKTGHINNTNFTNDYFSVHGLWAEYTNGSYPQFCNKSDRFDPNLLKSIYPNLTKYWTNYRNATDFWKHEFTKHATCAEDDPLLSNEYQFFSTGLALRNKYDVYQYLAGYNITPTNMATYSSALIYNVISKNIGYQPAITCRQNRLLDEVIICLDKNLGLMNCPLYLNSCAHPTILYGKISNY